MTTETPNAQQAICVDEETECPSCHGDGTLSCAQGCHEQECETCDGAGYIHPSDEGARP